MDWLAETDKENDIATACQERGGVGFGDKVATEEECAEMVRL